MPSSSSSSSSKHRKQKSNQRLHCSSKNSDDEVSYGKSSSRSDSYSYKENSYEDDLICCLHGKPCEAKKKQQQNCQNRAERPPPNAQVLRSPVTPIDPPSPFYSGGFDDGYENLQSLNNQLPIQNAPPAVADDNQYNYEPINDDLKASYEPISREPIVSEPIPEPKAFVSMPVGAKGRAKTQKQDNWHKTMYLGEMSRSMAEEQCKKPTSFLLYNRYPSNPNKAKKHMPAQLPLFIVYCTSRGDYCHYRIVAKELVQKGKSSSSPATQLCEFRVDISGEPYFSSLRALIAYYLTYVMVHGKDSATDVFPWWNTKNEYLHRADIYADYK